MIKKLIVAFIPTGIIGLVLYKVVKQYLLGNNQIVLWSLFLGGIILIAFEWWHQESSDVSLGDISYKQAALIGLFQSISIIPGVSRSAATILGGLWLGIKRQTIVEFSFLLAVPTMAAATGLDLLKNYHTLAQGPLPVLAVGFAAAFIAGFASIKYLLKYIQKHKFTGFGIYRIAVAIIFWIFV